MITCQYRARPEGEGRGGRGGAFRTTTRQVTRSTMCAWTVYTENSEPGTRPERREESVLIVAIGQNDHFVPLKLARLAAGREFTSQS